MQKIMPKNFINGEQIILQQLTKEELYVFGIL